MRTSVAACATAALFAKGADALDALWETTPVAAMTRAKRMLMPKDLMVA